MSIEVIYEVNLILRYRRGFLVDMSDMQVEKNKAFLVKKGIEHSVFIPTETGLRKSILDATQEVRTHFDLVGFHDYSSQNQGPKSKVMKNGYLVTDSEQIPTSMSLYRPMTKKGDPRMWFRGLASFVQAGERVAIVIFSGEAYLFNISTVDLERALEIKNKIGEVLAEILGKNNPIAQELLTRLRALAQQPIPAIIHGDTAVGMAVEHALGIQANSNKEPDYFGIELKSSRLKKRVSQSTRVNLFAQVADWSLSQLKSSAAILDTYGYEVGDERKLYCTVSAKSINSQGLYFFVELEEDLVKERHVKEDVVSEVVVWRGEKLRERLKEKHTETFWIEAESLVINGIEHFLLKRVRHTRGPLLTQIVPLIAEGVITLDHLIKRNAKGRVSEKGPLFKIFPQDLGKLFPEEVEYLLN